MASSPPACPFHQLGRGQPRPEEEPSSNDNKEGVGEGGGRRKRIPCCCCEYGIPFSIPLEEEENSGGGAARDTKEKESSSSDPLMGPDGLRPTRCPFANRSIQKEEEPQQQEQERNILICQHQAKAMTCGATVESQVHHHYHHHHQHYYFLKPHQCDQQGEGLLGATGKSGGEEGTSGEVGGARKRRSPKLMVSRLTPFAQPPPLPLEELYKKQHSPSSVLSKEASGEEGDTDKQPPSLWKVSYTFCPSKLDMLKPTQPGVRKTIKGGVSLPNRESEPMNACPMHFSQWAAKRQQQQKEEEGASPSSTQATTSTAPAPSASACPHLIAGRRGGKDSAPTGGRPFTVSRYNYRDAFCSCTSDREDLDIPAQRQAIRRYYAERQTAFLDEAKKKSNRLLLQRTPQNTSSLIALDMLLGEARRYQLTQKQLQPLTLLFPVSQLTAATMDESAAIERDEGSENRDAVSTEGMTVIEFEGVQYTAVEYRRQPLHDLTAGDNTTFLLHEFEQLHEQLLYRHTAQQRREGGANNGNMMSAQQSSLPTIDEVSDSGAVTPITSTTTPMPTLNQQGTSGSALAFNDSLSSSVGSMIDREANDDEDQQRQQRPFFGAQREVRRRHPQTSEDRRGGNEEQDIEDFYHITREELFKLGVFEMALAPTSSVHV